MEPMQEVVCIINSGIGTFFYVFDLFFNFFIIKIGPSGLGTKIVNFHRTEGYCTQKRDRISPAVQWWFNNHSNYIIRGCTTTCEFSCKDQSDLLSRLVGQLVQNCDTWRSFTRPENSINRLKSRMQFRWTCQWINIKYI